MESDIWRHREPRDFLEGKRDDEIVLVLTGDLFLTEPFPDPLHSDSRRLYDLLGEADVVISNLENGLSSVGSSELGGFTYGPSLRGPPDLVEELVRIGVDGVSLANNHTGNYGPEALLQTIRTVGDAGIASAGAGRDLTTAVAPTFLRAGARTIAVVSVYSALEAYVADDVAGDGRPGVALTRAQEIIAHLASSYDREGLGEPPYLVEARSPRPAGMLGAVMEDIEPILASLESASAKADCTILSIHFHWGRHTQREIPSQQRALAALATRHGADLVIGHGPHILRGLELVEDSLIAYSLGNFVLPPEEGAKVELAVPPSSRRSVLLRVIVGHEGPRHCELIPFVIDDQGQPRLPAAEVGTLIVAELVGMAGVLGLELASEGPVASIRL